MHPMEMAWNNRIFNALPNGYNSTIYNPNLYHSFTSFAGRKAGERDIPRGL